MKSAVFGAPVSFLHELIARLGAHRKVGRSVWWRFHSNRLTLLALTGLWKKNVLKLHIFVRLSIATENSSHALSPFHKKNRMHMLQICCFNRHSNLQYRMNCGPDGAELHHTTLLQCLGGVTAASTSGTAFSAASWHGGVEWSPHTPDPSPLDFFLRIMLSLKRTHVREPLTVIEFKIAIARESPRSPPISAASQWTTTGNSDFCRFLHISLKPYQSWWSESIWLKPSPDTSPNLEINSSKN